jgi:HPt (histidine-containing phosphotransfer) domain-containing protein
MRQFNGDEEILLDMINIFKESLDSLLGAIRDAIENRNGNQLRINAHTFKGVMSNFFAQTCEEKALALEGRGASHDFEDALEILNDLENQLMVFLFELHIIKEKIRKY